MSEIDLRVGDCLDVFGAEPDGSFDAYVCDWPAGVAFMGRAWDKAHGGREAWVRAWAERAAMMRRKAKPGAYALIWALPRTSHWTATALDDAGWVIQDVVTHVFGQGWPKGRSALKPASEHWILARNGGGGALQIDAARVARGAADWPEEGRIGGHSAKPGTAKITGAPAGDGIRCPPGGSWPPNFMLSHCEACEECGVRRVASGNNSGACGPSGGITKGHVAGPSTVLGYATNGAESVAAFDCLAACDCGLSRLAPAGGAAPQCTCGAAMWWACPVAEMDRQSGAGGMHSAGAASAGVDRGPLDRLTYGSGALGSSFRHGDAANGAAASRFFPCFSYQAKAAGGERHAGCDDLYWRADPRNPFGFARVSREEWIAIDAAPRKQQIESLQPVEKAGGNVHPTVKSIALMERLVALVTPPGGRVGDVTLGSGGTAIALHRLNVTRGLGATLLGCDICPEAIAIADARLAWWRSVRHDVKPVKRAAEQPERAQGYLFAR